MNHKVKTVKTKPQKCPVCESPLKYGGRQILNGTTSEAPVYFCCNKECQWGFIPMDEWDEDDG